MKAPAPPATKVARVTELIAPGACAWYALGSSPAEIACVLLGVLGLAVVLYVVVPVLKTLGAPLDRMGRAIVEPDCTIPGHPEVFVLGDAAAFDHQEGGPLPGICPVAIQMGEYTGAVIDGDLAGRPRRAFRYWDKGQLAVIGRGQAVADIWKLHFGGFIAWLVWIFVHVFFLIGFRNRVLVMLQWAWSYLTYSRGARLITEEVQAPRALIDPAGWPASTS